jgi:hypothetical protein
MIVMLTHKNDRLKHANTGRTTTLPGRGQGSGGYTFPSGGGGGGCGRRQRATAACVPPACLPRVRDADGGECAGCEGQGRPGEGGG